MKKFVIIITTVLLIALCDLAVSYSRFIADSDNFIKNDFEITQSKHEENVWDKVFFGNSAVTSAYIEEESSAGYVNLGLNNTTLTDLAEILRRRYVNVGSELVIGLNYSLLYDSTEKIPSYIWYKKWYDPYVRFEWERICTAWNSEKKYSLQEKKLYVGTVSDAKLDEHHRKMENASVEDFAENINALENIINYCREKDIRVRVIWMPYNPSVRKSDTETAVRLKVSKILEKYDTGMLDMERELPEEYFYDVERLGDEAGMSEFTKKLDEWL